MLDTSILDSPCYATQRRHAFNGLRYVVERRREDIEGRGGAGLGDLGLIFGTYFMLNFGLNPLHPLCTFFLLGQPPAYVTRYTPPPVKGTTVVHKYRNLLVLHGCKV